MSQELIIAESQFIEDAKQIVLLGRQQAYQAVNSVMTGTYWQLGKHIIEQEQSGKHRANYGSDLLNLLSRELTDEFGKGFTARALRHYRQFYLAFPELEIWNARVPNSEILHARVQNLSWTHYRTLLRVENATIRNWYLQESLQQGWSVRTLDRNIASQYYQRLLSSPNKEPVIEEMERITRGFQTDKLEFIKNPVVAEFLGLSSNKDFTETNLEAAIISHLQNFLMELGKGFAFVARQQRISTDMGDYYIDLVFYNYILKCFVLVDLKTTQISHQDVGQMDMYVRMFDEFKRSEGDNPTLGIILCSETSRDIARYSILNENQRLFASKYLLYLPTEQQLYQEIERQKEIFLLQQSDKN